MSTTMPQSLTAWLRDSLPLVAILRGIRPNEVIAVADALFDEGFRIMEVPLNSPEPFESIRHLAEHFGERALIGAGTVVSATEIDAIKKAGGRLIVSPNCDIGVINETRGAGLVSLPGVFSASEAMAAISAGAEALKLFPAQAAPPEVLKALLSVLPNSFPVLPVGGVGPDSLAAYWSVGAAGFGLGSALYQPGRKADEVRARARALREAFRACNEKRM